MNCDGSPGAPGMVPLIPRLGYTMTCPGCERCRPAVSAEQPRCGNCDGLGYRRQRGGMEHDRQCVTCSGTGRAPAEQPFAAAAPGGDAEPATDGVLPPEWDWPLTDDVVSRHKSTLLHEGAWGRELCGYIALLEQGRDWNKRNWPVLWDKYTAEQQNRRDAEAERHTALMSLAVKAAELLATETARDAFRTAWMERDTAADAAEAALRALRAKGDALAAAVEQYMRARHADPERMLRSIADALPAALADWRAQGGGQDAG